MAGAAARRDRRRRHPLHGEAIPEADRKVRTINHGLLVSICLSGKHAFANLRGFALMSWNSSPFLMRSDVEIWINFAKTAVRSKRLNSG